MRNNKWFKQVSLFLLLIALVSTSMAGSADAGLASGSKFLGNIIANNPPSNFSTYWNQVTPENSTKWGAVEGTRNVMNWGGADTAYNYAQTNGFPFKFHTLVWGSQEPNWVSGLSATNQRAEVLQWIQAAGQRYPNAEYVDVVNEPLHAKPSYRNAIGGDGVTGWDWVIWSFEQARLAFPNAKLHINEYGIISDPNAAAQYVNIINILKSRGLIDGIGIQCHYFNMDTVSTTTMNNVLNTLAATGLPIYVSELDMTGDDNTQLARYQQKFPVLWNHPAVEGVTLWGYIEGQTWATNTHLIRSNGTERPALQWLRTYLGGNPGNPGNPGTVTQLADFESGTESWSGSNAAGGPWSTTAWSSKGSRSLQIDINMTNASQHYMFKSGNTSFGTATQLKATVKGANWGNYGNGLGVKLYVKHGSSYAWKDSGWATIGQNGTINLTLDLTGVDKANIREYGIQFIGANGSSGTTAVYVDNVYLN
ncbi:putative 1,4-beta-xylanase [Paenibacillus sp. 598K]|nr:putative 1,4-beta-xylanase [Paenibacillus sp. 598K]